MVDGARNVYMKRAAQIYPLPMIIYINHFTIR